MKRLGLDLGTKHIVLAYKDDKGEVRYRLEMNAYLTIPRGDSFTEQLLAKSGVPHVTREDEFIAIGSKAEKLAYSFNKTLQRPMAHGSVAMANDDSQEIIAIIIKSLIGKLAEDAVIYYCTTSKPVNSENLNIDFHRKIVKAIIESYRSDAKTSSGKDVKIDAHHINEARSSWGAGTVTVQAQVFGVPVFDFSVVGSGDWIDTEVAKRFGYDPDHPQKNSNETPTSVCRRKEKIDLTKMPDDNLGKTIYLFYEILIDNVIKNIAAGFRDNKDKFRVSAPVPVVNAGGTSMPTGFMEMFKSRFEQMRNEFVIPIGDVKRASEPLFAVAKGCLAAAEMHKDD
jgi:actin-related protein